jgi:GTP-binding protein
LVHLLEVNPVPGRTPLRDYLALRRELDLYDPDLAARAEVVVVNKLDLPATRKKLPALKQLFARRGLPLLGVSAATGEGIPALLAALWTALQGARSAEGAAKGGPLHRKTTS